MPTSLRTAIRYLREAIDGATEKLNKMKALVNSMEDDPSLNNLTARELRAFHGFRQTLNNCQNMTDDAIKKHVFAHLQGGEAKQAITKLPINKSFKKLYNELIGEPTFDTNTVQKIPLLRDEVPAYIEK